MVTASSPPVVPPCCDTTHTTELWCELLFSGRSADKEAANNVNANSYEDTAPKREKQKKEKPKKEKKQKEKKQPQHEMQPAEELYTDTVEEDDDTYEYVEPEDVPKHRRLPQASNNRRY